MLTTRQVRLWDPRAAGGGGSSGMSGGGADGGGSGGGGLATLHGHKAEVTKVAWNPLNGNWLLSASKDQTLRLFDIR